jgi:hypothetical protein
MASARFQRVLLSYILNFALKFKRTIIYKIYLVFWALGKALVANER